MSLQRMIGKLTRSWTRFSVNRAQPRPVPKPTCSEVPADGHGIFRSQSLGASQGTRQQNLLAQLHSGVSALKAPGNTMEATGPNHPSVHGAFWVWRSKARGKLTLGFVHPFRRDRAPS